MAASDDRSPVLFNGHALPGSVHWLELVTYILDGIQPDIREWLLDIHYAGETPRSCASDKVLAYCAVLEKIIPANKDLLQRELSERISDEYSDEYSEHMVSEWLDGIGIMQNLARSSVMCRWWRENLFVNCDIEKEKHRLQKILKFLDDPNWPYEKE